MKPKNSVRNHKSSSADTRTEAAATVTATAEALPGPPVIDPVAIMQEVLDEHKRKAQGRHVLSEKDISGLLGTTALKTLVVLLAPPPQSCSCAQQPCALQQPCGVVAIVVHAKEPKSTAATRCLSAFFARLVAAVKDAARALKHGAADSARSHDTNSGDGVSRITPPLKCPAWVAARVCGAEWSNVAVLSDTNIAKATFSYG